MNGHPVVVVRLKMGQVVQEIGPSPNEHFTDRVFVLLTKWSQVSKLDATSVAILQSVNI